MFSNFFLFPIGHLTHPPTSKVFLDFWNFFLFTWPLSHNFLTSEPGSCFLLKPLCYEHTHNYQPRALLCVPMTRVNLELDHVMSHSHCHECFSKHLHGVCIIIYTLESSINTWVYCHNFSIQFNTLFQTHLQSISHNYMSQHNRKMQKQHINDSLCSLAYTLASVMDI